MTKNNIDQPIFLQLQDLRLSPTGEEMILEKNYMVEEALPMGTASQLSEEVMNEYR